MEKMSAQDSISPSSLDQVIGRSGIIIKETTTDGSSQSSNEDGRLISKTVPDHAFISLASYFNLPPVGQMEKREESQLQEIADWAREKSSGGRVGLLWAVRELEDRLGAPQVGETRLDKLYKWARLDREEAALKKEKALYER